MRRRALLAVGRDDRDLDAVDAQAGIRQFAEPFAVDAVVVGDEDADHAPRMVAQLSVWVWDAVYLIMAQPEECPQSVSFRTVARVQR